jgi:transposase
MMSKEVGMSRKGRSKGGTPALTQGARRATGESAGGGALAPGQRWSAGRKREVVLRILRGESLDALSRELGVEIYRLEEWRDKALSGLDAGLKDRQDDPLSHELDAAKRYIGELSMENELLRERSRAAEGRLPLATRRSRR